MKIEKRGIVITEVPGVEWIKVDSAEEIQVKLTVHEYVLHYTPETLGQFIEALTEARNAAQDIAGTPTTPLVFADGDSIPDSVTKVVDCEGDTWRRIGADRWVMGDWWRKQEPWLLSVYGPLTEVLA
jgi:hypothetical protein